MPECPTSSSIRLLAAACLQAENILIQINAVKAVDIRNYKEKMKVASDKQKRAYARKLLEHLERYSKISSKEFERADNARIAEEKGGMALFLSRVSLFGRTYSKKQLDQVSAKNYQVCNACDSLRTAIANYDNIVHQNENVGLSPIF